MLQKTKLPMALRPLGYAVACGELRSRRPLKSGDAKLLNLSSFCSLHFKRKLRGIAQGGFSFDEALRWPFGGCETIAEARWQRTKKGL